MSGFVEVIKNKNRMCEAQESCGRCPIKEIKDTYCMTCPELMKKIPEKVEEIVMKWAKEHPIQTYLDKFKELLGECDDSFFIHSMMHNGCAGFTCKGRECDSCERKDFWNKEYKAPTEEVSE